MAESDLLSLMDTPFPATNLLYALMFYPDHEAALEGQDHGRTYQSSFGLRGSVFPRERMHITLCHLESPRESVENFVKRVSRAIARLKLAPIEIVFDQIGGFQRQVVLLGSQELEPLKAFRAALREALAWEKLDKGVPQAFNPHMTLIYGQPGEQVVSVKPVFWTARELVLVVSHQGEGRHEVLARYPLIS